LRVLDGFENNKDEVEEEWSVIDDHEKYKSNQFKLYMLRLEKTLRLKAEELAATLADNLNLLLQNVNRSDDFSSLVSMLLLLQMTSTQMTNFLNQTSTA
jgi:hypothetical protein